MTACTVRPTTLRPPTSAKSLGPSMRIPRPAASTRAAASGSPGCRHPREPDDALQVQSSSGPAAAASTSEACGIRRSALLRSPIQRAVAGAVRQPPKTSGNRAAGERRPPGASVARSGPSRRETASGRCTCSGSSGAPCASNPASATTREAQRGMTGSYGAGALTGRPAAPSASTSTASTQGRSRRAGIHSAGIPFTLPSASDRAPTVGLTVGRPLRRPRSSSRSSARTSGRVPGAGDRILVVVVSRTRPPSASYACASASRNVLFPPAPTAATTSEGPSDQLSRMLRVTSHSPSHSTPRY